MGAFDELAQKVEGTVDEVSGKVNQHRGEHVKGGMQRLKGKVKKVTAPLNNPDNRERSDL